MAGTVPRRVRCKSRRRNRMTRVTLSPSIFRRLRASRHDFRALIIILEKTMRTLEKYNRKRKFQETREPQGRLRKNERPIFVVQRHAARRLHFDLRLQINGALASWAVPKGPPQEVGEKRLAVHVEDHPIEYAKFEGDIPKGNYGAGHVDIWDQGTFELEGNESAAEQVERGDLKFRLRGKRLNGRYVLVKMRNSSRGNEWLFIRKTDPLEVNGDADAKQNRPNKETSLLAQT